MVALDSNAGGVKFGRFDNEKYLSRAVSKYVKCNSADLIFLCIGTDRCTGDCFGPLVGTLLKDQGYTNVIGCIDDPVHALNLNEKIAEMPKGKIVLAIDACLGALGDVGTISLNKGKLSPGTGVGKELTEVGNYNIQGVVSVSGFMAHHNLRNTRLSLVMSMAKQTASAIQSAFPLVNESVKFLKA